MSTLKAAIYTKFQRQADCARACGMSENQLSRLVHGRDRVTPEQREVLARVFGVSADELFGVASQSQ
jgi:plasmid maintenance system antidote protein VapI